MKLIPVDVLAVILLIDLNLKSKAGVTLSNFNMKLEAIVFTALFAVALLATVLQAMIPQGKKKRTKR